MKILIAIVLVASSSAFAQINCYGVNRTTSTLTKAEPTTSSRSTNIFKSKSYAVCNKQKTALSMALSKSSLREIDPDSNFSVSARYGHVIVARDGNCPSEISKTEVCELDTEILGSIKLEKIIKKFKPSYGRDISNEFECSEFVKSLSNDSSTVVTTDCLPNPEDLSSFPNTFKELEVKYLKIDRE